MRLFKILFNIFKLACVICLLPIVLFTGAEVNLAKLFFGDKTKNNGQSSTNRSSASDEKVQADNLKRQLEVFELYDHPSDAQREFLNQIGLKPFVNDVRKWHRSKAMAKYVEIQFKDELFKWKVAIVKQTGYRFQKEKKIWALA